MNEETYSQITKKREFSQLPRGDVEKAYSIFEKRQVSEEEKIRLAREVLHKVFGAFLSKKLLSPKEKDEEWILRKHLSSRERSQFYRAIYQRVLNGLGKRLSVIDLGAGINGFSYKFFIEAGFSVDYTGIEAVGQLTKITEDYFHKKRLHARSIHMSLFDIDNIKKILEETKKPRVIFLFKVLDSLEMLDRNFSKKLLLEISPLVDRMVVSFATESMIKRKKFSVKRTWFSRILKENFDVLDDFDLGKERYIIFRKK